MARQNRSKRRKVRGNPPKAQFPVGLAEIVSETVRLWRKHHLGYDETKYVVEQARRRLEDVKKSIFKCGVWSVPKKVAPGCSTNDRRGVSIHLGSKQKSRKLSQINFFTSS
jgi:hypothetical protein